MVKFGSENHSLDYKNLYVQVAFEIAGLITRRYSTSFSMASGLLEKNQRDAIFSIYAFVRLADEIVDTFHDQDKPVLLREFEGQLDEALQRKISLNPVLSAFQATLHRYGIGKDLISAFLQSMKLDLDKNLYKTHEEISQYIYGSADVVGLMCLKVFCNGNEELYAKLKIPAMKLGTAFQKVNFLRDLRNDIEVLNRRYFPELNQGVLTEAVKQKIIADIESDFRMAYSGIRQLPGRSRLAVLVAYGYYQALLKKIKKTKAEQIMRRRLRISDFHKMILMLKAFLLYRLLSLCKP